MVMAAQARTLWELGWRWLPEMMEAFEELSRHLGTTRELEAMEGIYENLPTINFSSQLVERVPAATVVLELRDVLWSDWGKEERIVQTLHRIGKEPLFPVVPLSV
jgi:hypothetical protein